MWNYLLQYILFIHAANLSEWDVIYYSLPASHADLPHPIMHDRFRKLRWIAWLGGGGRGDGIPPNLRAG